MSIWTTITSAVSGIFKPVAEIVDEVVDNVEEKGEAKAKVLKAKAELTKVQDAVTQEMIKLESKYLDAQAELSKITSDVAKSEQEHGNWFSKSVRPFCMLFLVITVSILSIMGLPVDENIILLTQIFSGGYIGSRGIEKVSKIIRK